MDKKKANQYETPYTRRSQVELEDCICVGSQVEIKKTEGNVEVDDYATIENDVTFE